MTQSKKGPARRKNQVVKSSEGIASSNGVEHVAESKEPAVSETPTVEAPKKGDVKAEAEASVPVETSYVNILGFKFESTITKEEEVLLNKAVESGDLSHISKHLLLKGIQELGHIIETQRAVYDKSLMDVRKSAADLRSTITEMDEKMSKLDASVLRQKSIIDTLEDEAIILKSAAKESAALLEGKEEQLKLTQERLEAERLNSADVTIKFGNLKEKVWKYVKLSWFSRLTTDVETFFYGK